MSTGQEWNFKYSLPQPPAGKLVELSFPEIEEVLLNNLRAPDKDPKDSLWQLARFYSQSQQHEKALHCFREVLARQPNVEDKAATVLAMGQTMEQVGDFTAAARYYREALAFEPVNTRTWYFIHNNLGYSLNKLEQFAEAERFCRVAIAINPALPNGFKNLGIALCGQGRFAEAADCFVNSTQADAGDPRSLKLLEELLQAHPELGFDFGPALECCSKAVEVARQQRAQSPQPVIQRGWRKQWFLLRTRYLAWWRKMTQ